MRKIARFQVHEGSVHALCFDGTLWAIRLNEPDAEWCPAPEIPDVDKEFEEFLLNRDCWQPSGITTRLYACHQLGRDQPHLVLNGTAAVTFDKANYKLVEAETAEEASQLMRRKRDGLPVSQQKLGFEGHEFFYLTDQIPF